MKPVITRLSKEAIGILDNIAIAKHHNGSQQAARSDAVIELLFERNKLLQCNRRLRRKVHNHRVVTIFIVLVLVGYYTGSFIGSLL